MQNEEKNNQIGKITRALRASSVYSKGGGIREILRRKERGASHLFWLKVYEKIKEGCVIQKGIDTKTERGVYPA